MKMLSVPTASAEVRVFMRVMNGRRSYCAEPNPIALPGGDNSDVTNQVNMLCANRSAHFSSRKMAVSVLQKFDFLQFSLSKFIELLRSYLKSGFPLCSGCQEHVIVSMLDKQTLKLGCSNVFIMAVMV